MGKSENQLNTQNIVRRRLQHRPWNSYGGGDHFWPSGHAGTMENFRFLLGGGIGPWPCKHSKMDRTSSSAKRRTTVRDGVEATEAEDDRDDDGEVRMWVFKGDDDEEAHAACWTASSREAVKVSCVLLAVDTAIPQPLPLVLEPPGEVNNGTGPSGEEADVNRRWGDMIVMVESVEQILGKWKRPWLFFVMLARVNTRRWKHPVEPLRDEI